MMLGKTSLKMVSQEVVQTEFSVVHGLTRMHGLTRNEDTVKNGKSAAVYMALTRPGMLMVSRACLKSADHVISIETVKVASSQHRFYFNVHKL